MRVYNTLYSGVSDESFGIDNDVLKQLTSTGGGMKKITANSQNPIDQQDWNCDKITNCGVIDNDNICGGFNVKDQG